MIVFILGDSISCGFYDPQGGWADRLKRRLMVRTTHEPDAYFVVYNLAVDGSTSKDVLKSLGELVRRLPDGDSALALVAVGINDACRLASLHTPQVDLDAYMANIKQIAGDLKSIAQVVFVGLTPVDDSKTHPLPWAPRLSCSDEDAAKYDAALAEAAHQAAAGYVAIRPLFSGRAYHDTLYDGLHPTNLGHELIFEQVSAYLATDLRI